MVNKEAICTTCNGNHYVSLYEHKFQEKPTAIKDLYLNEKNFINCPECVGNSNQTDS